ncbi:hypothetical protein myaer87_16550 [Microcystis aeruginosa NIES-87]|uniref:hypothetical protein n=1 Tax=Microcystis aeruginosa TaxID=1126 RepID=UPI000CB86BA8|nr:hypothetical protein [Microcystis aeruginosa]WNF15595.1 hypothetical protein RKE53_03955 [Microcystis aeruginosa NRERC-214]GBE74428.1 hypothetical protein myaer87_16550 [Microcystis aeruginosa NIES-87]
MIKKFFIKGLGYNIAKSLWCSEHLINSTNSKSIEQLGLSLQYRQLYQNGAAPLAFSEVGFRVHSQNEEDGILLYIFSLIGTTNKKCVEICAGDGIECNTANLIINHRWIGLLCDGRQENVENAKRLYSKHPDTKYWPPSITCQWITAKNVNQTIAENGFNGEIDLLSLDIDGIDYWLWKEISCISPRVVVLEFNHLWGPDVSVTVPYADDFKAEFTQYGSDYVGASLLAFVKLGKEKGYRLAGTNAIATNAFFIREDIACSWLPEIEPATCFGHPRAQFGMKHRLPGVKDKKWIEV